MERNAYSQADYWSKKAAAAGYPARSVYKLEELNAKFSLIKKGFSVLDLGSAPGSWTLFTLRTLEDSGLVVSVDLNQISEKICAKNLVFIQGNLYDDSVQSKVAENAPFDAVLCDAAPFTTGNRIVDTGRSDDLTELAVFYAEKMLKVGGRFTVKIFQGGAGQDLMKKMQSLFASVKTLKPKACRATSFETYLVGIDRVCP